MFRITNTHERADRVIYDRNSTAHSIGPGKTKTLDLDPSTAARLHALQISKAGPLRIEPIGESWPNVLAKEIGKIPAKPAEAPAKPLVSAPAPAAEAAPKPAPKRKVGRPRSPIRKKPAPEEPPEDAETLLAMAEAGHVEFFALRQRAKRTLGERWPGNAANKATILDALRKAVL